MPPSDVSDEALSRLLVNTPVYAYDRPTVLAIMQRVRSLCGQAAIEAVEGEMLADVPDNEGDRGYNNAVVDCYGALRKIFPHPEAEGGEGG